jgi:hypothetical protein
MSELADGRELEQLQNLQQLVIRREQRIAQLERERDEAQQARDGLLEAVKAFLECRRGILSGLHERYERAEHLADTAIAKAEARA